MDFEVEYSDRLLGGEKTARAAQDLGNLARLAVRIEPAMVATLRPEPN
jgi:hypothetical protein